MKFKFRNQFRSASLLLSRAVLGMLLLCCSAHAASTFHISVNTTPLIGNSSGPFSIDFQLNNGTAAGLGNNTATISNFNYFGGSAVGSASLFGGAQGDLASGVLLNNSSAFQEFFQEFTLGTRLAFDVSLTSNVDGVTPDAFVFTLLDSNLFNITTTGLGDSLVLVNLDSSLLTVQSFNGTGAYGAVTTSVPEPPPYVSLLIGLPLLVLAARKMREAA